VSWASLEEERRFLLDSLRDLEREHEKGEIADSDYESLKDDYTARAAEVLRAIKASEASAADPLDEEDASGIFDGLDLDDEGAGAMGRRRHKRSRKVVAWAVIAGMVVLAGASVFALAGGRTTGSPATGSANTPAQRLALAHQYETQGKAVDALKQYDAVLKADPSNVEALTYRGWLLRLAGLVDQGQASIEKAVSLDPSFPDAHFFRGMILFQDRNDPAGAIPEFEAYLASNPPADTVQAVQGVLAQAKQAAASTTTTAPGTPPPAGPAAPNATPSPTPSPTPSTLAPAAPG
jgi:tetratricopeptide (TPR) repeat protein